MTRKAGEDQATAGLSGKLSELKGKKRKSRSAAKIRELKKKRASKRAKESATGVVSETAAGATPREADASLAARHAASQQPLDNASLVSTTITTARTNTTAVSDQAVASQDPVPAENQARADAAQLLISMNPTAVQGHAWVCLTCTFTNVGIGDECSSCRRNRPAGSPSAVENDPAATVTRDMPTLRVQDTSAAEELHPSDGESGVVEASGSYTTTTRTWQVARINGRRDSPRGKEYHVLWIRRQEGQRYYLRSWEPKAVLRADGFAEEIAVVDRWMASSGTDTFDVFWKKDELGRHLLGANTRGLCLFDSLARCAELAKRPDIVTKEDIDKFVADELSANKVDLTKGTTWAVFLRFLKRLQKNGRDFCYNKMVKNNHAPPGRRGAHILQEIDLDDGIYLVAAYNHSFIGHAIVLTVQGSKRLIYDKGMKKGKPVSSAKDWINFYAFVRPFAVFKKK